MDLVTYWILQFFLLQGGYVDCCRGVWRIQGSLAVSRAIGDRQLKQWVIAEPETTILRIDPECEFLVLASDGLWDKVTLQQISFHVSSLLKHYFNKSCLNLNMNFSFLPGYQSGGSRCSSPFMRWYR